MACQRQGLSARRRVQRQAGAAPGRGGDRQYQGGSACRRIRGHPHARRCQPKPLSTALYMQTRLPLRQTGSGSFPIGFQRCPVKESIHLSHVGQCDETGQQRRIDWPAPGALDVNANGCVFRQRHQHRLTVVRVAEKNRVSPRPKQAWLPAGCCAKAQGCGRHLKPGGQRQTPEPMGQHISAPVCRKTKPSGLPLLSVIQQIRQPAPFHRPRRIGPGAPELDSIIFFTDQHNSTPRQRRSSISRARRLWRCRTKGLDLERRAQQH